GIEETRKDFVKLATRITSFESQSSQHPALVNAIVNLTPITNQTILSAMKKDVIRRFLVYINRTEFSEDVATHSSNLVNAMVAFLKQINTDNAQITQYVHAHP